MAPDDGATWRGPGAANGHATHTATDRDRARAAIAERGMANAAIEVVVRAALSRVPPTGVERARVLLRRFFSAAPWRIDDDTALASIAGPGTNSMRTNLSDDIAIALTYRSGRLRVDAELLDRTEVRETQDVAAAGSPAALADRELTRASFDQPIVPEAGSQPRIVRFLTGAGTGGQSGWVRDADATRDERLQSLLRTFVDVEAVLLGVGFVAVELNDERRWDDLLLPILAFVSDAFATPRVPPAPDRRLERARAEFAGINPETLRGIGRVRDALGSPDPAIRQLAVSLMEHDDPFNAEKAWRVALDDSNRAVRRAAIIAMARVRQEALRALLERGLGESDACARFHAVGALEALGIDRSRAAIERALDDSDARVRLAARQALRGR